MKVIVDARAPKTALDRLGRDFELVLFASQGLTYPEVSGHPDIFLFQHDRTIVAAPNTPENVLSALRKTDSTELIISAKYAGSSLADSTYFNCCATQSYWFHKQGFTAPEIADILAGKSFVNLPQAYTRCSTSAISDSCIISSDAGICKAMKDHGLDPFFVDPREISLPNFRYGFFGGTNGSVGDKLYFLGNIREHFWGRELERFLQNHNIEPVCLCNGKLYDGGGLFFV